MSNETKIVQMNCQDGSSIRMHVEVSDAVEIVSQIDLIDRSGIIESHSFHYRSLIYTKDFGTPKL